MFANQLYWYSRRESNETSKQNNLFISKMFLLNWLFCKLISDYNEININVYLVDCNGNKKKLYKLSFFKTFKMKKLFWKMLFGIASKKWSPQCPKKSASNIWMTKSYMWQCTTLYYTPCIVWSNKNIDFISFNFFWIFFFLILFYY